MARATLKDVAQEAGVSSATVSYILNGKRSISEETKARVMEAIKKLDYVPDLNARGLTMRDSKLIGVVVPQTEPGERLMFQNSFYSEILGSIEYYARLSGYHILISATDANESYLTLAKKRNLDGIIVIGMYPDEFYQQMKKTQIPIVLIDSYCGDHYYHSIRIDDAYGSYLVGSEMCIRDWVSPFQNNSFPKSSQRRQSSARLIFWQSVPSVGFMRRGCAYRRTTP